MSNTNGSRASLTAVQAAPAKVAELLRAYGREAVDITGLPRLPAGEAEAGQADVPKELAALKVRTVEALGRLDDFTRAALADAREQLETEVLPVMSTDPQVQRLFELRRAAALARLTGLLERAGTEAAVDVAVQTFAADAARQGDWAALRVLRAEIAPCLARRGIDPANSQALRTIEGTVAELRPRSAPALAERKALEQGAARVALAFAHAREAVDGDASEVHISGYEDEVSEHVVLLATN